MIIWLAFGALVVVFLVLDLGVFNKNDHQPSAKEATIWTLVWIVLSICFSGAVYYIYQAGLVSNPDGLSPQSATVKYLTGYVIEKSLSIDNIFVISIIFTYFQIPGKYQHRVLFWGILGAVAFRGIVIGVGSALIHQFAWLNYVFGAFLLYAAWKMLKSQNSTVNPGKNPVTLVVGRFIPVTKDLDGHNFFTQKNGALAATPLFIALLVVESTDVLFAFDSIPAIFAITADPFLVFTSNIFAILGLRSLYFVLADMVDRFHYLSYTLVFILFFVGVKLILGHLVELPEWLSLGVILLALGVGIIWSLKQPKEKESTAKKNVPEASDVK